MSPVMVVEEGAEEVAAEDLAPLPSAVAGSFPPSRCCSSRLFRTSASVFVSSSCPYPCLCPPQRVLTLAPLFRYRSLELLDPGRIPAEVSGRQVADPRPACWWDSFALHFSVPRFPLRIRLLFFIFLL